MNTNLLTEFKNSLEMRGTASGTIYNYCSHIENFIDYLKVEEYSDLDTHTKVDYYNWVSNLQSMGLKNSTINNYIRSVTRFILWGFEDAEVIKKDTFRNTRFGKGRARFLKQEEKEINYMSNETVQGIFSEARGRDEEIMFSLMAYSGMRAEEVTNAKVQDIDILEDVNGKVSYRLNIPKTKSGKSRNIPLPDDFAEAIFEYVQDRKKKSEYIFIGKRTGKKLSTNAVYDRVKAAAGKVVDEDELATISPHTFRKTAATNWLMAGNSVESVGNALGHSKGSRQVTFSYTKILKGFSDEVFSSQSVAI